MKNPKNWEKIRKSINPDFKILEFNTPREYSVRIGFGLVKIHVIRIGSVRFGLYVPVRFSFGSMKNISDRFGLVYVPGDLSFCIYTIKTESK